MIAKTNMKAKKKTHAYLLKIFLLLPPSSSLISLVGDFSDLELARWRVSNTR